MEKSKISVLLYNAKLLAKMALITSTMQPVGQKNWQHCFKF